MSLLSRKGPLGAVLVAAYCHNRLKKPLVLATDIPFSVKKILDEGFSAFTYRILGFLLLGVVKIYSHKVEYVFLDCNQMLLNAKQAAVKEKESLKSSVLEPNRSITLPNSMELDKFIFEDTETELSDHMLPEEEIMLKDFGRIVQALKYPPVELRGGGFSINLETFSDSTAPDYNISPTPSVKLSSDDSLMFDDIESSIATLIQKLALPVKACEADTVNLSVFSSSCLVMSEVTDDDNEAQNSKHTEPESSQCQSEKPPTLSLPTERSPEMTYSEHSDDEQTSEDEVLPTPINIENIPVMRKRKRQFDEQVVLNNKTFKQNLGYSPDLLRKRGRVPHTALSVWNYGLVFNIKKSLTRPLIHCAFKDSNLFHFDDKMMSAEIPLNFGASIIWELSASTDEKNAESEKELIDEPLVSLADAVEHNAIAPQTPYKHATGKGVQRGDIFEKVREVSSSNTSEEELSVQHHEEENVSVASEADFEEPDGWSTSTGQAVRDLSSEFYANNGHELQQVNLQDTLKGASKKKSAKLFYNILVLKNRCMINVQQKKPYGDILVTKSIRWEN